MGVFHIFKIVQKVLNRTKHHIQKSLKGYGFCSWIQLQQLYGSMVKYFFQSLTVLWFARYGTEYGLVSTKSHSLCLVKTWISTKSISTHVSRFTKVLKTL